MQEQLRQIWADILSLDADEIKADEHLFDLGGDSVKAILIMAKAAEQQMYFNIQTLYANPTISSLADALGKVSSKVEQSTNPRGDSSGILADNQRDLDLLGRVRANLAENLGIEPDGVLRAERMRDDQVDFVEMTLQGAVGASSTFLYEVRGGADLHERLQQAITALTTKHPMLRTTFTEVDGAYYQVLLATVVAQVVVKRVGQVAEYAREAGARILRPGEATAHYALVEDDGGRLVFALSVLHCFFDGFSRTQVERDLMAALSSPDAFLRKEGERAWYGDFARHLDVSLDEEAGKAFRQRYLQGDPQLDTIYRRAPGSGPPPKKLFDRALSRKVGTGESWPARGRQMHLATAITTAWGLALMQRSGCVDVAFTVLTLGRLYPWPGIEGLVGLLVKDRPFRLRLHDTKSSSEEVLQGVQEDLVAAGEYEHGPRFPAGVQMQMQSYVNMKFGASTMGVTEAGGLTVVPRRDLERWESESRYAVYLEVKPVGVEDGQETNVNLFEMRYHSSLVDDEAAGALLDRFLAILERIGKEAPTTAVDAIMEMKAGFSLTDRPLFRRGITHHHHLKVFSPSTSFSTATDIPQDQPLPGFASGLPIANLPTVNYSALARGDALEEAKLLSVSTHEGFFYLDLRDESNPSPTLPHVDRIFRFMKTWFAQPDDTKLRDLQSNYTDGYKATGFFAGARDGARDAYESLKVSHRALHAPAASLPAAIQSDRGLFENYLVRANTIARQLLTSLSTAMDLKPVDAFETFHEDAAASNSVLVLLRYPHVPRARRAQTVGHNKHTDIGSITVLFTDQWGLQVMPADAQQQSRGGNEDDNEDEDENRWAFVPPRPGCAIINVGDSLRFLSGKTLRSCLHRVVPVEGAEGDRLTVAYFLHPDDRVSFVDSRGELVTAEHWHDLKYEVFRASHQDQRRDTILTGGLEPVSVPGVF